MRVFGVATTLLLLILAVASGCDRGLGSDTVARAGDFRLGVEEAARLLAPVDEFPEDPSVVEALADFWIDYSLLALVASEEGGIERLDLSGVTRHHLEQELVLLLREQVIEADTAIPDEELEEIYRTDGPERQVRARHILLVFPEDASEAQRDSVRALAEQLRDRARAGEDFAALAQEHSEDPGSSARGGDLGFFSRGDMVPAFDEAAFALEPGEVSEVVESQFGLHVIKVTPLDEVADDFRRVLQVERESRAESLYVASIEEPANVTIRDDAHERARELAGDVDAPLRGRAADRALATFEGGAFTAADFRDFLLGQPPGMRRDVAEASDEQLEMMLRNLTRGELLVREAHRRGIEVPHGEVEELEEEIRNQLRFVADQLGLTEIEPGEGESRQQAVDRYVKELMGRLVRGEEDVYPLGSLSAAVRQGFEVRTSREAMERTAERMRELRAEGLEDAAPPPQEEHEPGA